MPFTSAASRFMGESVRFTAKLRGACDRPLRLPWQPCRHWRSSPLRMRSSAYRMRGTGQGGCGAQPAALGDAYRARLASALVNWEK